MSALASPLTQGQTKSESARPPVMNTALFIGVLTLLLFGPVAFGAVEPWSIFVLEAGSAVLLGMWGIQQAMTGELNIHGNRVFPPMATFGVVVCLQLAARLTAYPYITISTALLYCAYGILCFILVQSLNEVWQLKALLATICGFGGSLAAFALLQGIASNGKLFWLRSPGTGWMYGPYINHNHYAGLMEMLIPVPLIFGLTRFAARKHRLIMLGIAALMSVTVLLSGSRGGMLALAIEAGILTFVLIRRKASRRTAQIAGAFLIAVLAVGAWIGGAELSKRLASIHKEVQQELSGGTRASINRDGLKMFKMRPVFGWGLGAFPTVYPEYRTFSTNFFVNEAHNDYLQLLVETGLLGFGAMLWLLIVVFRESLRRIEEWQREADGTIALAALLGIIGILVHSFLDFNLQIPANAAFFYVLCTMAAFRTRFKLPLSSRMRRSRKHSEEPALRVS